MSWGCNKDRTIAKKRLTPAARSGTMQDRQAGQAKRQTPRQQKKLHGPIDRPYRICNDAKQASKVKRLASVAKKILLRGLTAATQ